MKNLLAVQYCDLDNLEDFLGWILGRLYPVDSKGMAERVGFEPTVRFPARSLSRRVLSTAQPPLRGRYRLNRSRALHFSAIGRSPNVTRKSERAPSASLMINRAWRCTNRIHDSRDACGLAAFGEEGLEDRGAVSG